MLAIALTGGPGFGKSSTLAALEGRGQQCVRESAREIIHERMRICLPKRPSARAFAEQILTRDRARYRGVQQSTGLVFFDRGVVDALGMWYEAGQASWAEVQQELRAYPFHAEAFLFPPWQEIYAQDAERDQTFEDAVRVDGTLRAWYRRCGFRLVEVPCADVEARCNFILSRLRHTGLA